MFKNFIKEKLVNEVEEFDSKKIVAGVLIKCVATGNILLLFRNDKNPIWALVSGGVEPNENILEALKREIYEELFVNPNEINFKFVKSEQIPEKNMVFHYYEGFTNRQFVPILDHENLNYTWSDLSNLPSPLYKGLKEKILKI
jgi:ADP-ribose pyrophosphatase YjhB (NUDIX family)